MLLAVRLELEFKLAERFAPLVTLKPAVWLAAAVVFTASGLLEFKKYFPLMFMVVLDMLSVAFVIFVPLVALVAVVAVLAFVASVAFCPEGRREDPFT